MSKPGCMIYFDLRPALEHLSNEELGQLFRAILDFSEFGVVPELSGMAAFAFSFIRPRLERDTERYDGVIVAQRKYAVYVRESKKHGETPLSFEEWKKASNEKEQPISADNGSYPTTTTTASTSATTTQTAYTSSSSNATGESEGELKSPLPPIVKEMPSSPEPMSESDFEERRRMHLERFRAWTG